MAWIFLPGAMMMPSETPMDIADPKLTLGTRNIQVRGRLVSHLQHFIDTYMEPHGLDHSEIEETPDMDYTCRFYATKESFAMGMYHAMMDIDYRKFKQQSERTNEDGSLMFERGKEYHSVLNSIWSVSTRLNPAGGYYAPLSESNPRGYSPGGYSPGGYRRGSSYVGSSFVGSSFYDDISTELTPLWSLDADDLIDSEEFDVYSPKDADVVDRLTIELSDIPVNQWRDYLDDWEYELMKPYKREAQRAERARARKSKRNRRGAGRKILY